MFNRKVVEMSFMNEAGSSLLASLGVGTGSMGAVAFGGTPLEV